MEKLLFILFLLVSVMSNAQMIHLKEISLGMTIEEVSNAIDMDDYSFSVEYNHNAGTALGTLTRTQEYDTAEYPNYTLMFFTDTEQLSTVQEIVDPKMVRYYLSTSDLGNADTFDVSSETEYYRFYYKNYTLTIEYNKATDSLVYIYVRQKNN